MNFESIDAGIELLRSQTPKDFLQPRNKREGDQYALLKEFLKGVPEDALKPIDRPVFVIGMMRTGTTLLHNLLNAPKTHFGPIYYEILNGIQANLSVDQSIEESDKYVELMNKNTPDIQIIHDCTSTSGKYFLSSRFSHCHSLTQVEECWNFLRFVDLDWFNILLSDQILPQMSPLRDYLLGNDDDQPHPVPFVYEFHKYYLQALQVLRQQRGVKGVNDDVDADGTWILKCSFHLAFLKSLIEVYPNARFVWLHRDPAEALPSGCSLLWSIACAAFRTQMDCPKLGTDQLAIWTRVVHNALKTINESSNQVIHVGYKEFIRDPFKVTKKLYQDLEFKWDEDVEAACKKFYNRNPQHKHGKHKYSLEKFGLDQEMLRREMKEYYDRFEELL